MKKTALILLLTALIFAFGCAPVVLSAASAIQETDIEPMHIVNAKPIKEPTYTTCAPVEQSYSDEILALTNEHRAACGLPELSLSPALNKIATLRAVDMAENDYFNHLSPSGQSASDLLQAHYILYFNTAENIGKGDVTSARMMDAWMDSPEHRDALLSKSFHQLGVGIVQAQNGDIYWVALLIN